MPLPLEHAKRRAEELGHEIEWAIVGDHLAHGNCVKCGRTVHLTSSEQDGSTMEGPAVTDICPASDKSPS